MALVSAACGPGSEVVPEIADPPRTGECEDHADASPEDREPPPAGVTPPGSPNAEVDARLRGLAGPQEVEAHVQRLRAADPGELDASCLAGPIPFRERVDGFRGGPTSTRTAACEGSRCLLRLESVGERTVSGLHVYYTRGPGDEARAVRCHVLRGG